MFKQAAAVLLMATSAGAATIPIHAGRASDPTGTSIALTATGDAERAEVYGSSAGTADAGLALSIADPESAYSELNIVLLLTLVLLAASVASIPGRH